MFKGRDGLLRLRAAEVVGGRDRGTGVVPLPITVAVPVVNSMRVPAARGDFCFCFSFRGRGVEAAAQEFFGSGQSMMGLEAVDIPLHHVHQETDGGAAVVSLFADQGGEVLVECVLRQAQDERGNRREVPAFAGTTGWGRVGGNEGVGRGPAKVEEFTGSVETMAGLGIFQATLHEVDEEADNEPAVVGLLPDDVGEGLRRNGSFDKLRMSGKWACYEHIFYFRDGGGGCQGGFDRLRKS